VARVLAIEPWYGGSHRAFLDGWAARTRHEVHLLTMPARFWKWRMRGAALRCAERARASGFVPEAILASDMLSLAEFLPAYGRLVPAVLYMHENQLVYPDRAGDERDHHLAFTNLSSCLAATRIAWSSPYHLESFIEAAYDLVASMPDERPDRALARIRERSVVIPPGTDLEAIDAAPLKRGRTPVVLWNHRWEHDKRPEDFFEAMYGLAASGASFRVAVLGESFERRPPAFDEARRRLGDRIAAFGWVEDVASYHLWLRRSSISVSTAAQESFGIAAVEAAYAGARPLWPDRLSYPGLMPGRDHLYRDAGELLAKLEDLIGRGYDRETHRRHMTELSRYGWKRVAPMLDELVSETARSRRERASSRP
jgi:glycosyltransferase involved in cell wall biosynthesis